LIFNFGPVAQLTDLITIAAHDDDNCAHARLLVLVLNIQHVGYHPDDQQSHGDNNAHNQGCVASTAAAGVICIVR
jgi:hypothetical protein